LPNASTCPTCLGFPGTKPQLNKAAVELAVMAATAVNCKIAESSKFARKTYYYPDLPKSYQITQYDEPLAAMGEVEIESTGDAPEDNGTVKNKTKKIRIRRVHMEEDPGSLSYDSDHIGTAKYVLIDYSRSGTPLCEIVTEPDMTTAEEAVEYCKKLFRLLEYYEIIDPHAKGVMRTDANVSIEGGERVELKNITGFAALEKSIKAEINRQAAYKASGKTIERETRVFSEQTGTTIKIRGKESEDDYGYIDEPDLRPLEMNREEIEKIKQKMKRAPEEIKKELNRKYSLNERTGSILLSRNGLPEYFHECATKYKNYEKLANWICGDLLKCLNWNELEIADERTPKPEVFVELLKRIDSNQITERGAKEVIKRMVSEGKTVDEIVGDKNETNYDTVISATVNEFPKAVEDYRKGNEKSLEFLVGQAIKKIGTRAEPGKIRQKILSEIAKISDR
ncbi:Asp-tRNA(Asn)/Glu-tRNA(Gln) amidotransferase subunit GatB, partial [Candidatus Micrarchaeota archaeon]|nr:Asp-tRNA(Asn)/Glu-tRNA(Gln) amidotransferase subunit GatB [Candidatus Micrarchaeota archaeon]